MNLDFVPNFRAALDAGRVICFHVLRQWSSASERGCSAIITP